jgi:16S rRNA (cytosine967-C5)-methyltransferase
MGNARKTVLRLLTRLENSGSYSNILLDEGLERSDLSPQDKKFAAALFYGVLERQITLDNIIREYSRNPKNKLGTEVRVILRIGLYQLLYMDSVPDNAAVDESVKLAKKNRKVIIPIGSSGFESRKIYNDISNNITQYPYLEKYIDVLGKSRDAIKITDIVLQIIAEYNSHL